MSKEAGRRGRAERGREKERSKERGRGKGVTLGPQVTMPDHTVVEQAHSLIPI